MYLQVMSLPLLFVLIFLPHLWTSMPDVVPPPVGMAPSHGGVLGGCSRVPGQGLATCCVGGACSGPLEPQVGVGGQLLF